MKKIILSVLMVFLAGSLACGQSAASIYMVSYEKQHYLYAQDDAMNVIDLDLEWPEMLNGQRHDSLQVALQRVLFGHEALGWRQAAEKFLSRFGKPVRETLSRVPDDDKFCYVTCSLKEMGMWRGRFASFLAEVEVQPHKLSPNKASVVSRWLTYDLLNDRFLSCEDILRMNRIMVSYENSQLFSSLLLTHLPHPLEFTPMSITMAGQVGVGNGHLIVPFYAEDENGYMGQFSAYIPLDSLDGFLTKDFTRLLSLPVDTHAPMAISLYETGSDSIHAGAVVMPEFNLPGVDYKAYIQERIMLPALAKVENADTHVLASFVVEKDGTLSNISLLDPGSPSIDREVANLIRLMPRWKPGMKNEKKVRVRQMLPMSIRVR